MQQFEAFIQPKREQTSPLRVALCAMEFKVASEVEPGGCGGADGALNGALAADMTRSTKGCAEDDLLDQECQSLTSDISGAGGDNVGVDRSNGVVVTPPLPKGCQPLSHQVAGHMYGVGTSKAGLLQDGTGAVLKPAQNASRGKRERMFYHNVSRPDQPSQIYSSLRPFVPRFYGTFMSPEDTSLVYLKINDVTTRFRKPCIMDVKIGSKSYEDGVSLRKVELAKQKYPNLEKIGFQILGMRVYHPATDEFECQDKFYGRSLHVDNAIEGFARYLNVVDGIRIDVIPEFLKQLKQIQRWFMNQKQLHFFSSSLLFVYEGATPANSMMATSPTPAVQEIENLSTNQPNFVSYSHLKRAGPKVKPSAPESESLPMNLKEVSDDVFPVDENGFVNRLPTYQESIAAKMVHNGRPVDGGVNNNSADPALSTINGGETQPRLLDINGRLTVSQMRERQRSLSQSNCQAGSPPPQPVQSESPSEPALVDERKSENVNHSDAPPVPVEAEVISIDPERESDSRLAIIKMIDFTHVVEADTRDESYLFGLRNVIHFFESLHNFYGKE
ncbi:uncharacterized protein [Asterias amurensis]|uniref:uncharacterized protein n=1 Tax=Asterias amurensis TaxID=7602 RepID=UPI003AB80950